MILNDVFATARERIGGQGEGEMIYRFPDSRLWMFYEREFKPLLARKIKWADCGFAVDLAVPAGTSTVNLYPSDVSLTGVGVVNADGSTSALDMTTVEHIERAGHLLSETGTPQHAFLAANGAASYLGLWPVPSAGLTLRIEGKGLPTSELVYNEVAARWETPLGAVAFSGAGPSLNMFASRLTAVIPAPFYVSCADFLAWKMEETKEENIQRPVVPQQAQARFARSFLADSAAFNMQLGGVTISSQGLVRRIR